MASLPINAPFTNFQDSSGQPLESGYIFIGTVNLNPETNPVSVFWDSALTIPAAQPLRTAGGYIVRNGTPAKIYSSAASWSITVKDRNLALIYSSLNESDSFSQTGAGAVSRTFIDKARESVSVEDYGAVGDGVVDDRSAFVNADASTQSEIVCTNGTYFISADLIITSPVCFVGGKIKPANGVTVTLNGGVIAAQTQHIFDLSLGGIVMVRMPDQSVEWFGTVHDGITDDSSEIQACVNSVKNHGGGNVIHCYESYAIASTIIVNGDCVVLKGFGSGYSRNGTTDYQSAATYYTWIGAAGGTMVRLTAVDGGAFALKSAGIIDIGLNCALLAGKGLEILSMQGGKIDCSVYEATSIGVDFALVNSLTTDPLDNQANRVDLTVVNKFATSGTCVKLGGSLTANTSLNYFGLLTLLHYNGVAIDFDNADGNVISQCRIYRNPAGTGRGIVFRAGATTDFARYNTILWCQTTGGGVLAEGTASGAVPSFGNQIIRYSFGNASPFPTIEAGAGLSYGSDSGIARLSRSNPPMYQLFRENTPAASLIGNYEFNGLDSLGNETRFGYVSCRLSDATDGSEDGQLEFATIRAGAEIRVGYMGSGLVIGSPVGSDKGAGTINAQAVYDDNVLLTDYVFDVAAGEPAKEEDGEKGAIFDRNSWQLDPVKYADFWKKNRHLPAMPSRELWRAEGKNSVGDLAQRLWETVEVQAVHISNLQDRISKLEHK